MPVEDARESGVPFRGPAANSRRRDPEPERISGPSFLGLAGGEGGSSDYLLEEAPRSTWRAWLVLIILLIVGALFYLQWKTNWRANPHELPPPPAAPASPSPTAPQSNAAPPSDATGVPAAQHPPQQADAAAPPDDNKKMNEPKPPERSAASAPSEAPERSAKPADDSAAADDDANPPDEETTSPRKSPRQPIISRDHGDPSRGDAGRDPMLYMAQKYLRGGGPGRNCDQAMVYLKAANERPSAPARSQMGALYATGTCVPLDRVRAYKWFTSAMDLDPNNESLRRERVNVWGQMSADERQQAVK